MPRTTPREAPLSAPELARLRARDREAFGALVDAHSAMMLRLASAVVGTQAAEEIVLESWAAAFEAIERFEGRSSIRTWLGQIALNRARTFAKVSKRTVPLSSLAMDGDGDGEVPSEVEALVDAFGYWHVSPMPWSQSPEEQVMRAEVREAIEQGLAGLPELQRLVVTLRDVEGLSPQEACHILEITESNQRQLLHRHVALEDARGIRYLRSPRSTLAMEGLWRDNGGMKFPAGFSFVGKSAVFSGSSWIIGERIRCV